MDIISALFSCPNVFTNQQMLAVFFFTGLGFFILSAIVLKARPGKSGVTRDFYALAAFGILHGIGSWLNMARTWVLITTGGSIPLLDATRFTMITLCFVALLTFGLGLLATARGWRNARWIPYVAGAIFLGWAFLTGNALVSTEPLSRFLFAFPGSILAVFGLLEMGRSTDPELELMREGCSVLALAFAVYAVFGGLISFTFACIPPQVIRMVCAGLAAYGSLLLLRSLRSES